MTKEEFRQLVRDARPEVFDLWSDSMYELATDIEQHDPVLAGRVREIGWSVEDLGDYVATRRE